MDYSIYIKPTFECNHSNAYYSSLEGGIIDSVVNGVVGGVTGGIIGGIIADMFPGPAVPG